MKKWTLLLLLMSFFGQSSLKATHIVGGELFYDYLGHDSFKIHLYLYIDCINGSPAALELDTVAAIAAFRNSDSKLITWSLVDTLQTDIVKSINYNCLIPPTNVCVVRYSYEAIMVLPDTKGGYTLAFQRCCRNKSVINIQDQDNTGGSYFAVIPERGTMGNNSSPRFNQLPPNFLCVNNEFSFKHNAYDPDGDSLSYELMVPYDGADPLSPVPRPPAGPPYQHIVLRSGFSINNYMRAKPHLKIDPETGLLTCTPRVLGQFVVGIAVKEYRNGKLISTVYRDFQLNVINCKFDVVSAFTLPEQSCQYQVKFKNNSTGAIRYKWNFGDPNTKADTSENAAVTYTYPTRGWYTAKLIAYSKSCSDTFYKTFYVKPDTGAFAGPDVRSCNGESVQIGPATSFPKSSFHWYPSTYLNNDTLQNPTATPPSDFSYVLRQVFEYCYDYDTMQINVGPPEVKFDSEPVPECNNLTLRFSNQGEGNTFRWTFYDFSKKVRTTDPNPYYTYSKSGKYKVKFVATLNKTCSDSIEKTIVVTEDTSNFAGFNRKICFGDTVQLGQAPISSKARFSWHPAKTLSDSTVASPLAFPKVSTTYTVERFIDICSVWDTVQVLVDHPQPFFQLAYTYPCDGKNVKVYNRSTNCEHILWDFGANGGVRDTFSNRDSVSFAYPDGGKYTISLLGTSAYGCNWTFALPLNVYGDTGFFAGPDSNLCRGQILQIGLNDTISFAKFRWSPKDSVSDYTIPNPFVNPYDTGVYVLSKVYPECTFTDTIVVGVHNPLAAYDTDYDPHCDLFRISLKNNSKRTDRLRWDFGHEIFESNADSITSTFPAAGNYLVQLVAFKEQCSDTFSRLFKAYVDTGVVIIPDSVACVNEAILLGAADTAQMAQHVWTPGDFLSSDTIANPTASPTKSIVYTYSRIFPKCTYTGQVSLRVAEPIASFDTVIRPDCYGYKGDFTNTSSAAEKYKWSFSNNTKSKQLNESQIFAYGSTLKATLLAIDAHCIDTFSVSRGLLPFDSFEIIAPNVFTPNGDGYNDCFRIEIPKLPPDCKNFTITFFNRWGQQMFVIEQEGNVLCWDGTYNHNDVPVNPGVYLYMIDVLNRHIHGMVQVIR
ncbi:T9SS type B sorting domain-containing protein [bacterium]|nr:T9SS type B sorting domain-containing protein [bacterium]